MPELWVRIKDAVTNKFEDSWLTGEKLPDGSKALHTFIKGLLAVDSFTEADLVDGKITAPEGVLWGGCDVYNDGSSDLSFVLKNGTETVFTSFSLKSGESLENESFNKFNIIQFTGTDPKIRVLVRG